MAKAKIRITCKNAVKFSHGLKHMLIELQQMRVKNGR